jgi:peptidoglycan/LPS O-acetylase OafA/YrhL
MPNGDQVSEYLRRGFRRSSSSLEYIPEIDGLRAVAMFLVLGHHVLAAYLESTHRLGTQSLPRDWARIAPLDPFILWGINMSFGVQLFCVISGFVLAIPFARTLLQSSPAPSAKLYLMRRLIRLEPPYVISLLAGFVIVILQRHFGSTWPGWVVHLFFPHLLASLVYLHGAIYGQASWINGVSWTLEIEVQFYLLLPILARIFCLHRPALRRMILLTATVGTALLAQFALPKLGSPRLDLALPQLLQFFLAGLLLADFHLDPPPLLRFARWIGDALALLSGGLVVYVLQSNQWWRWTTPLLVALLFFSTLRSQVAARVLRWPLLTIPGAISYTVYLYHQYLVRILVPLTLHFLPPVHALWLDFTVQFVLMTAIVLPISAGIYLLTERPFVEMSHRVTRRMRAACTEPRVAGV